MRLIIIRIHNDHTLCPVVCLCYGFWRRKKFSKGEGSKRRDLYLLALLVFGKGVGSVGSVLEGAAT